MNDLQTTETPDPYLMAALRQQIAEQKELIKTLQERVAQQSDMIWGHYVPRSQYEEVKKDYLSP